MLTNKTCLSTSLFSQILYLEKKNICRCSAVCRGTLRLSPKGGRGRADGDGRAGRPGFPPCASGERGRGGYFWWMLRARLQPPGRPLSRPSRTPRRGRSAPRCFVPPRAGPRLPPARCGAERGAPGAARPVPASPGSGRGELGAAARGRGASAAERAPVSAFSLLRCRPQRGPAQVG